MITTPKTICSSIERSINAPSARSLFDSVKHAHPALAPFADPASAAAFLQGADNCPTERSHLTLSLVRLARETNDALWNSILVRGFIPMLWGLCKTASKGVGEDDAVGLVFQQFAKVVQTFDLEREGFIAPNLVRRTRRVVAGTIRSTVSDNERYESLDDPDEHLIDDDTPERLVGNKDAIETLMVEIGELARHEEFPSIVALVAPERAGLRLSDWLRAEMQGAPPRALDRKYKQLRKRRLGAICRIRRRMNGSRARAIELLPAD